MRWTTSKNLSSSSTSSISQFTEVPLLHIHLYPDYANVTEVQTADMVYKMYIPFCAGFGIAGNCLTLMVLLCGRVFTSTAYTYMAAIAGCDLIDQRDADGYHDDGEVPGNKISLKASSFFTIKRARVAVVVVALLSVSLNLHNLFTRGMQWDDTLQKTKCYAAGKTSNFFLSKIWPWIDGSVYCYLPFPILAVLNYLIVREIRASKQSLTEVKEQEARPSIRRRKESRQITIMLLFVTVTFLILVGPMGVMLVTQERIQAKASFHDLAVVHLVRTIVDCLTYTHHAINFLLYCLSGGKFRREVLRIVCRIQPHQKQPTNRSYCVSAIALTHTNRDVKNQPSLNSHL
ncbi:hypothetical protein C0Q70_00654 [Pomacea canaliculata]|uniref:G-protein coupled receptors family 1 profile domain-containing protein n=1 Tax=Pomacea canaliculata TaxID=400727 RepID=A0A2T7PXA0_POMCA|nr:hypothetical protein C0Q70_00654 [Pomacea canaliculata]